MYNLLRHDASDQYKKFRLKLQSNPWYSRRCTEDVFYTRVVSVGRENFGCGGMDWTDVAQGRDRWQAVVNALTLTLLTWRIWRVPNNASKWQMGFNSAFKGLMDFRVS